ncbi:MAG: formate acetyltransferase [Lentisphaeria bacterium]|nr:formate acetyltransferase [Lentisphaeria bacterium]
MIQFINQYPETETFDYHKRLALLRERKLEQTAEKVAKEGGLDEDDYGRVVPPDYFKFKITPNNPDGHFYGYSGWTENFTRLLAEHPLYVDPLDAFVGRGFFFLIRLRGMTGDPSYPYPWNPAHPFDDLKPVFARYNIICGIGRDHHFNPDIKMGMELGWGGILKKLEHYRAQNPPETYEFYDSEIAVVKAIISFLRRISHQLAELSLIERNPTLKRNLEEMADINFRMADGSPKTMREAVQWMCWFSMLSRLYNRGSAGGQLDQLLLPYYENDIKAGRITDDEARFYLGCLFFNDSRYYQLGGPDIDGNDTINHLSYLILEAANEVNIACNLTVRVHDKTDPVFLRKAVGYLFSNRNGWPRFSGDTALVNGFMRCGFPRQEAIARISSGCHWMSIPGKEYTLNDIVKINTAKVFEMAWREMMDDGTPSLEELYKRFLSHLKCATETTADGIRFHLNWQDQNEPELILNLLSHGPIEKGADVTKSATYFNMCVDGAALATVADSFAAVEQRVIREKRLTFAELDGYLTSDFAGTEGEYVRQMLQKSERYCQGDTLGDRWAVRISRDFSELVRAQNQRYPGLNFIPGWFSWSNTIYFGRHVGATPNGRKAGSAINHGANPHPGFRHDGAVTAMCNSIAAIQPGYGNTAPVQLELDPGIAESPEALDKLVSMIRTLLNSGNTLLNINIIDEDQILRAHEHPELYPDLVVRVTGFTAYFSMLSKPFRQLVVDRIISKRGVA